MENFGAVREGEDVDDAKTQLASTGSPTQADWQPCTNE